MQIEGMPAEIVPGLVPQHRQPTAPRCGTRASRPVFTIIMPEGSIDALSDASRIT
jgi:hypothetical protein